jgi:ribosome-binding protein aMBF1 (putative translation factor)
MEKSIHSTRYAVFLKVLREGRERAGLTQVQLAKKIGEMQTFVSKCERGERRVDVVELRTFCRAFGMDLKQFVAALEKALGERASKGKEK